MLNLEAPKEGSKSSISVLTKIAEALGCSVTAFSEPALCDVDQTAEMVRLWLTIGHEQDQEKVLSFVRLIADQATVRREA